MSGGSKSLARALCSNLVRCKHLTVSLSLLCVNSWLIVYEKYLTSSDLLTGVLM